MAGKINVKGMTIKDLMNLDNIYQLDLKDSKAVLNRLVSAANKRLERLRKTKTSSPALIRRMKRKKRSPNRLNYDSTGYDKFSSKGVKTANDARVKIRQLQKFLQSKTSTVRGYNQYRKELAKRGLVFRNRTDERKFWQVYEKLLEDLGGEIGNIFKSDEVQKWLHEEMYGQTFSRSRKKMYERMMDRLELEYLKRIGEGGMEDDESDIEYFEQIFRGVGETK